MHGMHDMECMTHGDPGAMFSYSLPSYFNRVTFWCCLATIPQSPATPRILAASLAIALG